MNISRLFSLPRNEMATTITTEIANCDTNFKAYFILNFVMWTTIDSYLILYDILYKIGHICMLYN